MAGDGRRGQERAGEGQVRIGCYQTVSLVMDDNVLIILG